MSDGFVSQIHSELQRLARGYIRGNSFWMCCPFHQEQTPSMSVALSSEKTNVGNFHCFGCGVGGGWNKLAAKIGGARIDEEMLRADVAATPRVRTRSTVVDNTSVEEFLCSKNFMKFMKWPDPRVTNIEFFKKWYNIPGKLLFDLEAYLLDERNSKEHRMFLPVKVHGVVHGGVRVLYEKVADRQTYLTTEGTWVKTHGLFPFDYTRKILVSRKIPFVILVEGPRDALRLLHDGLPALATLGSNSMSERKALLVTGLPVKAVYVMPDSDRAGEHLWEASRDFIQGLSVIQRIKLPEKTEVRGELVNSDPQNVSSEFIEKVVATLSRKHGCVI